jgi:hypothetical protein
MHGIHGIKVKNIIWILLHKEIPLNVIFTQQGQELLIIQVVSRYRQSIQSVNLFALIVWEAPSM